MSDSRRSVPPVYVFCDFDGTIAQADMGDEFVRHFGDFKELHARLMDGKMTVAEYWTAALNTFPAGTTQADVDEFVRSFQLDDYFARFVKFCEAQEFNLAVVSDGFENYIRPMLQAEGLQDVPVYSNNAIFHPKETPKTRFPNADEACTCFCASCKRNVMLRVIPDEAIVIYVGDGYSDTCAAEHADIIFAKDKLAAYCNRERLPHFPYRSFYNVITLLEKILAGRGFKPRHQAVLKRRRAYIHE